MNAVSERAAIASDGPPTAPTWRTVAAWSLFALLCVTPLFFSLGNHPIHGDSEARYGVIARGMAHGETPLLVPTYFDQPHLTKPPLTYWLMAASIRLLGDGELALRLPAALSGVFTLTIVFGLAFKLHGPRQAAVATAIVSVTPMFVVISRMGITDGPLGLFITAALAAGVLAGREQGGRTRWVVALWVAVGLALLTKGPAGLLPPAALVIWLVCSGRRRTIRRLRPLLGLTLALLPLIAWAGLVAWRHPEAWGVWKFQVWDRAAGTGDHPEPWWFFAPVFALGLLPATALLTSAVLQSPRRNPMNLIHSAQERSLWIIMCTLTFLIFTLISGKLMSYLMPLVAPMAWMTANIIFNANTINIFNINIYRNFTVCWAGVICCICGACIAEDFVFNRHSAPALVDQIRNATGLEHPHILTVGFGDRSLPYYTHQPTRWIDPRVLDPEWEAMRKDDLVLVADSERWDIFAADPNWSLDRRWVQLDLTVALGYEGHALRVYLPRPEFR